MDLEKNSHANAIVCRYMNLWWSDVSEWCFGILWPANFDQRHDHHRQKMNMEPRLWRWERKGWYAQLYATSHSQLPVEDKPWKATQAGSWAWSDFFQAGNNHRGRSPVLKPILTKCHSCCEIHLSAFVAASILSQLGVLWCPALNTAKHEQPNLCCLEVRSPVVRDIFSKLWYFLKPHDCSTNAMILRLKCYDLQVQLWNKYDFINYDISSNHYISLCPWSSYFLAFSSSRPSHI